MIISDELWKKFKTMRQEILDLKQLKKASCASKYYEFDVNTFTPYNVWLITYKDGNQPIISEVLSFANSSLSIPNNNQQYLFTFSQTVSKITILSTREIESVEGVE
jgi:hypothetical protein